MKVFATAVLAAVMSVTGCAVPTSNPLLNQPQASLWRGRLAVRVVSDQSGSFVSGFELTGSPLTGELTLFTPLGNTAAALSWSAQTAVLRSNGEVRYFESLNALIRQAVGTDIPVVALFAWLAGNNMDVAGWSADLSQYANGRITARRTEPEPVTELRLVLD